MLIEDFFLKKTTQMSSLRNSFRILGWIRIKEIVEDNFSLV